MVLQKPWTSDLRLKNKAFVYVMEKYKIFNTPYSFLLHILGNALLKHCKEEPW